MELTGASRPVLDGREEWLAVLSPAQHGLVGLISETRPALGGIGMHEVEALVSRKTRQQRRSGGRTNRVPAHMRQHRRFEPVYHSWPHTASAGALAVLAALGEEHLHADADAKHRPGHGKPLGDDLIAPYRAKTLHARGKRTDAWHNKPVGVERRRRGTAHHCVCSCPLHRTPCGPEIS